MDKLTNFQESMKYAGGFGCLIVICGCNHIDYDNGNALET